MKPLIYSRFISQITRNVSAVVICAISLSLISCGELEKPKTEEFYSETEPPRIQEFRWTNGKLPKTFDPAMASAPPETDLARALYEGLTDMDSKTLKAIPAVATEWTSSEEGKVWTFKLRNDAKWSNGKSVKAEDFVRSWKRLADIGDEVPHHELLKNIEGMRPKKLQHLHRDKDVFVGAKKTPPQKRTDTVSKPKAESDNTSNAEANVSKENVVVGKQRSNEKTASVSSSKKITAAEFGAEAVGDYELKVTLAQPDKQFPKLVAHPVFRPVYAGGEEFEEDTLNPKAITNGAFQLDKTDADGVVLKRSDSYWNRGSVKLEKVRFVPTKDAESALQAYRDGKVDAVTNAQFEPLALKLLTPYFDFKRVTHSALNLFEFNRQNPPFNDRRVREALAIAIERKKLTDDEMDGATIPAANFLPFTEDLRKTKLALNVAKAKELLKKAGFENGEGFPRVRLVVNRNNIQQRIAKSVAKMWKEALNIETDIIVKEASELEVVKKERDFDVVRRGVVLPTSDETANMLAIFRPTKLKKKADPKKNNSNKSSGERASDSDSENANSNTFNEQADHAESQEQNASSDFEEDEELIIDVGEDQYILTEEEALVEVPGIPLYFPTSYSLVKPYVKGFEINSLDAPSLKEVEIDNDWQPKNPKKES